MTKLEQLLDEHNRYTSGEPLTIRSLAAKTGVAERTVYRHIRGESSMDLRSAAAYAKALDVKIEQLVDAAA